MAKEEFQKRGVDYQIVDGMRTLPGKYYHSQEIYQEEVEKIFYKGAFSEKGAPGIQRFMLFS